MRGLFVLIGALLLGGPSWAALLTPEGQGAKIEKVQLPQRAQVQVDGEAVQMTALGAGLRSKKVVFVNVRVYVGQLFVSSPETFKRIDAEALSSLKEQKAVAIQLHFLRAVDAENVQKSFKEALKVNSVNLEDAAVKEFLANVAKGGEAEDGKTLTILGTRHQDGTETVAYENTKGQVSEVKGTAGFISNVFAIWLGTPSDDGVAQLKKDLLNK